MKLRLPWWGWLLLIGGVTIAVCAAFGLLEKLFGLIGTLVVGTALIANSGVQQTGKSLGFSPEEEVPDAPRRGPAGPISPPTQRDDPEAEPMHPSRRGSD